MYLTKIVCLNCRHYEFKTFTCRYKHIETSNTGYCGSFVGVPRLWEEVEVSEPTELETIG